MFPKGLRSVYFQYKEDTDAVATWLAKTARSCGYSGELLDEREDLSASDTQPSQQSNGKTRHASKSSNLNAQSFKSYKIISTRAFPILARFIAESTTPPVTTPPVFVQILDRSIALRKKFADTGSRFTSFRKTFATEGHQHFVSTLEEVKNILSEKTAATADVDNATSPPSDSADGPKIGDRSEDFVDACDIAVESEPEYKADQFEDPEELYLAFKLLAQDFADIRKTVIKLWKGFDHGTYRSVAAALATNTAIDFARRLEQDITDVLNKHGGFEKVYNERWLDICKRRGKDWELREQPGDEMNFKLYKDADQFMLPTYMTMKTFLPLVQSDPKSVPFSNSGTWGEIDRKSNWNTKTSRSKFQSDRALLMEVLTALTALIRLGDPKGLKAEDELIRGLRTVIETRKICFWNILSAQILLDIHHCLRHEVDLPFENLRTVSFCLRTSVMFNRKEFKDIKHVRWPQSHNRPLTEIWELIVRFVVNDDLHSTMLQAGIGTLEKHFIFKHHPVYCGLFQYSLQMRFHVASIDFANAYGVILATRHLYNAFKQEKLLSADWEDMRKLEFIQRDQPAFKGEQPTTKKEHWDRYVALHTGDASAPIPSNFCRAFQHETTLAQGGLKYSADLARMFMHRYCDGSGRVDFTPGELKKILEETVTYEESKDGKRSAKVFGRKVYLGFMLGKMTEDDLSGRVQLIRRLTIPELLERFANAISGETGTYELSFNYLHMHSVCWFMLKGLKPFSAEIAQRFGDSHEFLKYEFELAGLVGFYMLDFKEEPPQSELRFHRRAGRIISRVHGDSAAVWEGIFGMSNIGHQLTGVLERVFNLWSESDWK